MKKRLKEAEEEQYRVCLKFMSFLQYFQRANVVSLQAEEDSASLRAQLNTMQQQVMSSSYSGYAVETSSEQTHAMEKEIQDLQDQLKVACVCITLRHCTCLHSCLIHYKNFDILKNGKHSKSHC